MRRSDLELRRESRGVIETCREESVSRNTSGDEGNAARTMSGDGLNLVSYDRRHHHHSVARHPNGPLG